MRLHTVSLPENTVCLYKASLIPCTIGKHQEVGTRQKSLHCSINENITETKNKSIYFN